MPMSFSHYGPAVRLLSRARRYGYPAVAFAVTILVHHSGAWADSPQVGCSVPHFEFVDNGESQAVMYVKPGAAGCVFNFRIRGGQGGTLGVLANSISTPPRHGMVGKASIVQVGYKPNSGYVGDDGFDLHVRYDRNGVEMETRLHVSVRVTADTR